ncbi:hypothetical protein DIZ81_00465 [Legionella taurinensis]|uniref:Uncharacterized protein n=1 Tax=Legionella taurinensis TaxID=70611 RepID=A0A3A5LF22_9GAMM|nr:hypothetical protein [Legionella taurinensis]MDX1836652.1 hypothetical protein [Legionella taurinensis]PUT42892.1 hypothetical protein DB744_00470 [Legionella taurinensis]PUT45447.1 hypothetical protein DB746_00470 [Legionella taurinensis]PUT46978.1 hypothetical protein DB743_03530 [Legionella taurinensis]PUT49214.1 hypothetical protein DB745_00470 [Legionella taurinensis]
MSRLQELINTVAQIIINYYEETQSQNIDVPLELLYAKPHDEFMSELDKIIQKATSNGYHDRQSLLQYARQVVNDLRPLVEKGTPLSTEEELLVKNTLKSFVADCGLLLKTDQGKKLSILYGNDTWEMKGCIRGVMGRYNYAVSGTVLNELLFSSPKSKFQFPLFPSPIQDKTTLSEIESMITIFINQHQNPLKKHAELKKENERLKKQCEELESSSRKAEESAAARYDLLFKRHQDLQKQFEQQETASQQREAELTHTIQTLELDLTKSSTAYLQLEQQHQILKKHLDDQQASTDQELGKLRMALAAKSEESEGSLTTEIASLKELLKQKTEAHQLLEAEVSKLREENSTARYLNPKNPIADLMMRQPQYRYGGLLFGRYPSSSPSILPEQSKEASPSLNPLSE